VRRCIGFSRGWGDAGLVIVNLFAIRGTSPLLALRDAVDPVGPKNDQWILTMVRGANRVVAAWGDHGAMADVVRWSS